MIDADGTISATGGGSGSTVDVTQIQTTGTKIATITVDSVGTDLYAPNGGGSGHTILDDEGTSLTQRDDLQFKGAYSEDDSTDEKTIVNVVREMTKAEFDELTEEEKTGLINITDITGGNDDRFQPVIYSEEERVIGVWTDGKPLYEKTYHQTSLSIASNTELTIDDFTSKFPVSCYGVMQDTTDGRTYYPSWSYGSSSNYNIYYKKKNNGVLVLSSENDTWGNTWELFTVVRYTKDSDAAGSGQWTPQGVPAHHYSEDEQIVGTWIDGSTLYEKVFVLNTQLEVSSSGWTSTNISIDYISAIFGVEMFGVSNYQGGGLANIENNILRLQTTRNSTAYVKSFALRYTKSS